MSRADDTRPPLLIALAGAARTGKDTIGLHLKRRHGFAKTSFAQPLYDALAALYGITPMDYFDGHREAIVERIGRSVRELLQDLGDHVRAKAGDDILIRRLVERCTARGEWRMQDLVITDLRRLTELEWLRHVGGRVWWVRRTTAQSARPHPTENIDELMLHWYRREDGVIENDGGLGELVDKVDGVLASMRNEAEAA